MVGWCDVDAKGCLVAQGAAGLSKEVNVFVTMDDCVHDKRVVTCILVAAHSPTKGHIVQPGTGVARPKSGESSLE